jgi:hypothetical protein
MGRLALPYAWCHTKNTEGNQQRNPSGKETWAKRALARYKECALIEVSKQIT